MITAICDTGPLVAYLNRHNRYHTWAGRHEAGEAAHAHFEPVLTQAVYFFREDGPEVDRVI